MYYYTGALALPKTANARWTATDLSRATLQSLMDDYVDAYVGIQVPNGVSYFTSLSSIFGSWIPMNLNSTLEQWLTGLPTAYALPKTSNSMPTVSTQTILYSNGYVAQYVPNRIPPSSISIGTPEPLGALTDVLMTRSGTDYNAVNDYCLFTINGYLHSSQMIAGTGIRVVGGGRTNDVTGNNKFGVISFKNIGAIQQIPITASMISTPDPLMLVGQTAYVNLGVSLVGKSLAMSIGGYLHTNDNTFQVVNYQTGLVVVNLGVINLMERLFESSNYIDLSSLGLTAHPYDKAAIKLSDLANNAIMTNYLTLSQTFAIVIDAPSVYTSPNLIERTDLPGRFITPYLPALPLRLASGRLPEYSFVGDHGRYALGIDNALIPNYQFETTDWQNDPWIFPNLINDKPYRRSLGHLLEIGTETVTVN